MTSNESPEFEEGVKPTAPDAPQPPASAVASEPDVAQNSVSNARTAQPPASAVAQNSLPSAQASVAAGVAPSKPAAKSHGWIVAIVAIAALCLVMLSGIWSCSSAVSSVSGTTEQTQEITTDAVGVITLSNTIQYDGSVCSPEGFKAQLDRAAANNHIVAVVLRVDSGGGVATAGEEMTEYLRKFCEETKKPVVVSSASTNASAAYEISSQADYIFTAKTSAVGAIGTAIQLVDFSGLMELLGITTENITSSSSKDSTYGTRALTEDERTYYQAQVDQINEVFIQNVAEGRSMDIDKVRTLATGLTYTGIDAVENGLADAIGTQEDAIQYAAELAGYSSLDAVALEPESSSDVSALLDLVSQSDLSVADVASVLEELENNGSVTR